MKPSISILDESFRYVPSTAASVAETWRRFGWRPTTNEERVTRRLRGTEPARQRGALSKLSDTTQ